MITEGDAAAATIPTDADADAAMTLVSHDCRTPSPKDFDSATTPTTTDCMTLSPNDVDSVRTPATPARNPTPATNDSQTEVTAVTSVLKKL